MVMMSPQQSGYADGAAGRPMAGESMEYAGSYRVGRMVAGAQAGDFILAVGEGSRCQRCDAHFFGGVGGCGCELPGDASLVRGVYVLYGHEAVESGARFMSAGELKALFATGLRLLDVDGVDVSCQIQLPQ